MRFDIDDQQRALQQAVADYLTIECPKPRALAPHDRDGADLGIWHGLMGLGLGAIMVPESHGGLGLGLTDLAVIAEPVGRFAAPGPFFDHALGTLALVLGGNDAQRDAWLPGLASGALRATVALSEAKGAWHADQWRMAPTPTLTGEKHFVLHAEGADLIIVGLAGGQLGLVRGNAPGLGIVPLPSTDAGKRLCTLRFDNVQVELFDGVHGARLCDAGLILLSADSFGGASQCVAMAVDYANEREQFGQIIGRFQAIKHQLADMAIRVEPCLGLYWYAAHMWDSEPDAAPLQAALAKSLITENYAGIARCMIEAHGGVGYTWDFGVHVWLKRALFNQAYLGMPQALRRRIADLSGW